MQISESLLLATSILRNAKTREDVARRGITVAYVVMRLRSCDRHVRSREYLNRGGPGYRPAPPSIDRSHSVASFRSIDVDGCRKLERLTAICASALLRVFLVRFDGPMQT